MSLYLGKDSNNKAMLVISKNPTSEAFIKNSLPSISNDYAIDTRRDLLFCDTVKVSSPAIYRTYTNEGLTYYVYRVTVSSNFITFNNSKRMSLYFINNFSYRVNFNLISEFGKSSFGANSYYQGSNFIDVHTLDAAILDITFLALRITEDGISYPYEDSSNRDIKVSNSEFLINGIDYFSRTFLVTPPVNIDDSVFTFGGKSIQIVNSKNTALIKTVGLDKSSLTINNGSKTILNSNANYLQLFMRNQTPSINNFTMPGGFYPTTITIASIPNTYKVLGVTYYPRVSVYPNMKAYGIMVNSGTTTLEIIYQDVFPVDMNGEIIEGFMSLGFYIDNGIIKAQKIVEYDGDPIGVYPSIQMRLDYIVLAE